jgi:hypothetical protein
MTAARRSATRPAGRRGRRRPLRPPRDVDRASPACVPCCVVNVPSVRCRPTDSLQRRPELPYWQLACPRISFEKGQIFFRNCVATRKVAQTPTIFFRSQQDHTDRPTDRTAHEYPR